MTLTKKILPLAALLAVLIPGGSAMAAPKSKFRFTQATYVTSENASTVTVTVTRAARGGHGKSRVNQPSTVNWAITGGTAAKDADYSIDPVGGVSADHGKLAFGSGIAEQTLVFTINQDTAVEPLESIQLKLSAASNNSLITQPRTSQVLIADDDGPTMVQLVSASPNVNESTGNATFFAVRSGDATGSSLVDFATSDGTNTDDSFNAHAPGDYTATAGTDLTFAGPTSTTAPEFVKTVTVPVIDDSDIENPEDFNLTLSNVRGAAFPSNTPSVTSTTTIVDNDAPPVFALDASSYSVNENGSVDVTVRRLADTSAPKAVSANDVFDVNWTTTDGTASNPADYMPGADQQLEFDSTDDVETITIAANDADTQIALVDDTLGEGDETFGLSLASAAVEPGGDGISPSIGSPSAATVTIKDNDPIVPKDNGSGDQGNGSGSDSSGSAAAPTSTGTGTGDSGPAQDQGNQLVLGARQAACGLVVKATKKQRLLRQKSLKLKLRAGQRCKISVAATIKKARSSSKKRHAQIVRSLKFKGKKASLTLQPGEAKTVKVKFTKKTLKAIKKALQTRNKLVATVVITSRDAASKVHRKTLKITIRR